MCILLLFTSCIGIIFYKLNGKHGILCNGLCSIKNEWYDALSLIVTPIQTIKCTATTCIAF